MAESEDDALHVKIDQCMEIALNLCVAVIKQNIKGNTEFTAVLADLGIEDKKAAEICEIIQT